MSQNGTKMSQDKTFKLNELQTIESTVSQLGMIVFNNLDRFCDTR